MSATKFANSLPVTVRKLPADYSPKAVEDAIRDVVDAMNGGFAWVRLQERHSEPTKTDAYTLMMADGTDWDPLGVGGQTLIIRNQTNTGWRFVLSLSSAPSLALRTFLQTPSSANLIAAVTDETGTGPLLFGTNPTITDPMLDGVTYSAQSSITAKAAAATLTIAELLTRKIRYTGAGAANLTTPTGTQMDAGILSGALPAQYEFEFSIINTGGATATLVANTDVTLIGAGGVSAGSSGLFSARKTAANSFTIYRNA